MTLQSLPRRRRTPPPQCARLGDALRDVYPEDHEADLAMERAIRMLDEMTGDGPSFAGTAGRRDPD